MVGNLPAERQRSVPLQPKIFQGVSKPVQVLFNGIEAVMVLTLKILK